MGIQIEFTPDLALRNISEFKEGRRKKEECIPENLKEGETYGFLKEGQRAYWLSDDPEWGEGQIQLYETKGGAKFSKPLASVKILEYASFLENGKIYTKGKYKVVEIFKDNKIHFEGFKRIKN